jgi:hypothetical protein
VVDGSFANPLNQAILATSMFVVYTIFNGSTSLTRFPLHSKLRVSLAAVFDDDMARCLIAASETQACTVLEFQSVLCFESLQDPCMRVCKVVNLVEFELNEVRRSGFDSIDS